MIIFSSITKGFAWRAVQIFAGLTDPPSEKFRAGTREPYRHHRVPNYVNYRLTDQIRSIITYKFQRTQRNLTSTKSLPIQAKSVEKKDNYGRYSK